MRISLLFCSLSVKLFSDGAAIIVDFTAISASGVCMYVAYLHASHKILSEVANLQHFCTCCCGAVLPPPPTTMQHARYRCSQLCRWSRPLLMTARHAVAMQLQASTACHTRRGLLYRYRYHQQPLWNADSH